MALVYRFLSTTFCLLICGLFVIGCQPAAQSGEEADVVFQEILDAYTASDSLVQGAMMHVEAPGLGLSWQGAAGIDDWEEETALLADQPFRIASVTKTFVAATIVRFVETGRASLEDPIAEYLSPLHQQMLIDDGYDTAAITVHHALNHTSGLFDYAFGDGSYVEEVFTNPQHRWTRTAQLEHAMVHGDPLWAPGNQYRYSDTGYILLGEMIETVADTTLAAALRLELDYAGLGLHHTWLESLEPAPEGHSGLVHQYMQGIDTYHFDPSMDLYGGGGLVSTTRDLALFFYGLFNGKVFDSPATEELLLTPIDRSMETHRDNYRYGIQVIDVLGKDAYAHSGFWGILAAYVPEVDAAIVVHIPNGSSGNGLLKQSVRALKELGAATE